MVYLEIPNKQVNWIYLRFTKIYLEFLVNPSKSQVNQSKFQNLMKFNFPVKSKFVAYSVLL